MFPIQGHELSLHSLVDFLTVRIMTSHPSVWAKQSDLKSPALYYYRVVSKTVVVVTGPIVTGNLLNCVTSFMKSPLCWFLAISGWLSGWLHHPKTIHRGPENSNASISFKEKYQQRIPTYFRFVKQQWGSELRTGPVFECFKVVQWLTGLLSKPWPKNRLKACNSDHRLCDW